MFEDSTFESMGTIRTGSRGWMMATFALNGAVLLALAFFPLLHPQLLPAIARSIPMEAPPPLEPLRPQPVLAHASASASQFSAPAIQAPPVIPRTNPSAEGPDVSANIDISSLSRGGNPVGQSGPFHGGSNVQVVEPKPRALAPVSSGVMDGLLIKKVMPDYPLIAKTTGTQGTVILQATISATGSIVNLHVLSGPALLRQAALDAVRQWRYSPYLLNRQPVEVETTVNVVFTLH
jgi:periplasmic protein TonB